MSRGEKYISDQRPDGEAKRHVDPRTLFRQLMVSLELAAIERGRANPNELSEDSGFGFDLIFNPENRSLEYREIPPKDVD